MGDTNTPDAVAFGISLTEFARSLVHVDRPDGRGG